MISVQVAVKIDIRIVGIGIVLGQAHGRVSTYNRSASVEPIHM
jgi:hypothetical protein